MPFVKLDCGILDSSLWSEDSDTRIVWITLLAMSNPAGEVHATVSAIARRAAVPRDKADKAIETFLGPDAEDRSGVNEGRRLERVQGGFKITNYLKYREHDDTNAVRQRRYRERHGVTPVTQRNVTRDITQAEAEADASASADAECSPPLPPAGNAGGGGARQKQMPDEERLMEGLLDRLHDLHCPERDETILRHVKTALASGLSFGDFAEFLRGAGHSGKHVWSICQAVQFQARERQRQADQAREVAERRNRDRIVEAERKIIDAYLAQCCDEELAEMKGLAVAKADEKKLTDRLRDIFIDASIRSEALHRATPPQEA